MYITPRISINPFEISKVYKHILSGSLLISFYQQSQGMIVVWPYMLVVIMIIDFWREGNEIGPYNVDSGIVWLLSCDKTWYDAYMVTFVGILIFYLYD